MLSRETNLETHVSDIVGLFQYRDLNAVTLVGHSYGGTVITAVAEQVRSTPALILGQSTVPSELSNGRSSRASIVLS